MSKKAGTGKPERFIQPSLLMALLEKPSYGYELSAKIGEFGFLKGDPPPGMVYRHLRQMEEEGLLRSEWDAEGSGPAKRVYALTDEGREVLHAWVDYMDRQARNLTAFVKEYRMRAGEDDAG